MKIEVGEVKLEYQLEGTGERTVVLLHGIGGMLVEFDTIVPDLVKRWRVLRYDQRGFGKSSKPLDKKYSVDVWADDLHGLLRKLGIRAAVVVGHSMGGRIACRFASKFPDETTALVPLNTTMWGSNPEGARVLRDAIGRYKRDGIGVFFENAPWYQNLEKKSPKMAKQLREEMLANDPDSYALAAESVAADFMGETDFSFFKDIRCPTLIIVGDRDSAPFQGALEMRRLITHSHLGVIPDCSHFSYLERPEVLISMLTGFISGIHVK